MGFWGGLFVVCFVVLFGFVACFGLLVFGCVLVTYLIIM